MAFIVCVIEPDKIDLIRKIHLPNFMDILHLHSFSYRKISYRWSGLLSQMMDFWASIAPSHVKLLICYLSLVAWYMVQWLLLWLTVTQSYSTRHFNSPPSQLLSLPPLSCSISNLSAPLCATHEIFIFLKKMAGK